MEKKELTYNATGRRKTSTARVRLFPNGTGKITVNGTDVKDYFPYATLIQELEQPLVITENREKFDVVANIKGGGFNGQAGALRHGISRALLLASEDYRAALKAEGFLTRDARKKERRKYGYKKARKSPQFSKR